MFECSSTIRLERMVGREKSLVAGVLFFWPSVSHATSKWWEAHQRVTWQLSVLSGHRSCHPFLKQLGKKFTCSKNFRSPYVILELYNTCSWHGLFGMFGRLCVCILMYDRLCILEGDLEQSEVDRSVPFWTPQFYGIDIPAGPWPYTKWFEEYIWPTGFVDCKGPNKR